MCKLCFLLVSFRSPIPAVYTCIAWIHTYTRTYIHAYIHAYIHTYRKLAEAELKVAKADRDVAKSKLHILEVKNIRGVQLATAEEWGSILGWLDVPRCHTYKHAHMYTHIRTNIYTGIHTWYIQARAKVQLASICERVQPAVLPECGAACACTHKRTHTHTHTYTYIWACTLEPTRALKQHYLSDLGRFMYAHTIDLLPVIGHVMNHCFLRLGACMLRHTWIYTVIHK